MLLEIAIGDAYYCIYQLGRKADLGRFLEEYVPGSWSQPWSGEVGSKGWMSVQAALTALSESNSMSALLLRAIAFTGDVDTVAAIALAAGFCCLEIEVVADDSQAQHAPGGGASA